MLKKAALSVACFAAVLTISSNALAAPPASVPPEFLNFTVDDHHTQTANIPNREMIEILALRFKDAKTPLSHGDLRMGERWDCREFFSEISGYSNYRFRSVRFETVESGIIEDQLNYSPRFYTYQHGFLIGPSNTRNGDYSEVRVDHDGNLRIANFNDQNKLKSITVCFSPKP